MARKASAQAKRAMKLASSRGISLKAAWGIVKRGGGKRRVKAAGRKTRRRTRRRRAAPRTVRRMARRRRSSGRKRGRGRGTVLTPKNLLIAAPAIVGTVAAIKGAWENHTFYNPNGGLDQPLGFAGVLTNQGGKLGLAVDKHAAGKVAIPLIGGAVASKGVKIGLNMASKALPPAGKKVLNYKIARV